MWKTAALLQQFASAAPSTAKCVDAACTKPGHDPSAMQRVGDYHVVLTTGSGGGEAMGLKYMNDSSGWRQGEDSYFVPPWLATMEPWKGCAATACPFWAPDLVSNGNGVAPGGEDFVLYYSVPSTTHPACIGRAEGRFIARGPVPRVDWRDALGGPVLCGNEDASSSSYSSDGDDGPHVIDPSVSVIDGIPWLSFGSWSSDGSAGGGVWVVPLDPATGALADDVLRDCGDRFPRCWGTSDRFVNVANNRQLGGQYADTNAIEASYLSKDERVEAFEAVSDLIALQLSDEQRIEMLEAMCDRVKHNALNKRAPTKGHAESEELADALAKKMDMSPAAVRALYAPKPKAQKVPKPPKAKAAPKMTKKALETLEADGAFLKKDGDWEEFRLRNFHFFGDCTVEDLKKKYEEME